MAIQFAKVDPKPAPPRARKAPVAKTPAPAPVGEKRRGRPSLGGERVTLRLDPKVRAFYKAKGPGWQAAINRDLMALNRL